MNKSQALLFRPQGATQSDESGQQIVERSLSLRTQFPGQTILAIAGVEVPEEHQPQVDGRDLTALFRGEPTDLGGRTLIWHMPHEWGPNGPGIDPFSAVRVGPWKLLYFHADQRLELYNLEEDPGEKHNLYFKNRETAEMLSAMLIQNKSAGRSAPERR